MLLIFDDRVSFTGNDNGGFVYSDKREPSGDN